MLERLQKFMTREGGRGGRHPEDGGRFWWHWQNLNEKPGGRTGLAIVEGRAWFNFEGSREFRIEWCLRPRASARFGLELGDDEDHVKLGASALLGALYFGASAPEIRRLLDLAIGPSWRDQREVCVSVHDGSIHWSFWNWPHEWSSKTPRWRHGWFNFVDAAIGKPVHEERVVAGPIEVEVPMPERAYRGTCTLFEATWRRARWLPRRVLTAKIEMLEGEQIPVPGKGENSYDCGEDAIFGQSGPASTVPEAVAQLVQSALHQRDEHGGRNWRPAPKNGEARA